MPRQAKPWFYNQTGWWMAWLAGKKVKLAKGKRNKRAAQERLEELRLLARKKPTPDAPDETVVSVIERYMEVRFPALSEGTVKLRTSYLQSFAEMHGWRLVRDCGIDHLEQWLHHHPGWVSDWTKRDAVMAVQTVFNWAAKANRIEKNPFAGFTHLPGPARRDITPEEFRRILRATATRRWKKPTPGARFRQILFFLYYTGCRPSEARTLTWSDVDFEHRILVLKTHKTIRMQRVPKPRIVAIDDVVIRLLRAIETRREGEQVFLTQRGTPWKKDTLAQRLRRAREAAGVPEDAKLYGFRHAFGTRGVINGCDLKTLSVVMGHTDTKTTEHYAHIAGKHEHLAAAVKQINQHFVPSRRQEDGRYRGTA